MPFTGPSPKYLVGDGVSTGPLKTKVSHLQEFGRHPDDEQILPQGGHKGSSSYKYYKSVLMVY